MSTQSFVEIPQILDPQTSSSNRWVNPFSTYQVKTSFLSKTLHKKFWKILNFIHHPCRQREKRKEIYKKNRQCALSHHNSSTLSIMLSQIIKNLWEAPKGRPWYSIDKDETLNPIYLPISNISRTQPHWNYFQLKKNSF